MHDNHYGRGKEMEKNKVEDFRQKLKPFLKSKLEEFYLCGYDQFSEEELWTFLITKKWKKIEEVKLHRLVEDIMSVKAADFMNYTTIEFYKKESWLDSEEGQQLLKELL